MKQEQKPKSDQKVLFLSPSSNTLEFSSTVPFHEGSGGTTLTVLRHFVFPSLAELPGLKPGSGFKAAHTVLYLH